MKGIYMKILFVADTHEGTIAIGDYIKEKEPLYHFYGHLHIQSETYIGNTCSRCIYGLEVVEINSNIKEQE